MNEIRLFLKINIFSFIYYLLFFKILIKRFLLNLFAKSKINPDASMMKYLNISIMNKLLNYSDLNKSKKIFSRSIIINYLTYKLTLSYLKYFYLEMPRICKVTGDNLLRNREKGIIYITFHFSGNMETLIYYLSRKHKELNLVYSNNFIENFARKALKIKKTEEVSGLEYFRYFNPELKINLINIDEPAIIFKIINHLKNGRNIIILFDEFSIVDKVNTNNQSKYIEYKIGNRVAARVPRALFTILDKTNSVVIPIVNLRKGCILNNIKVFTPIIYDSHNKAEDMLKKIYDNFLICIKECPERLHASVWKLFTEYVKDNSPVRLMDANIDINSNYEAGDKNIVSFRNHGNFYLLKLDNFRIIKVDSLTVKLFNYINKKNRLPGNFQKAQKGRHIITRLSYLLKTGFIVRTR